MQQILRTVVFSVIGLVVLAAVALGLFAATFDPNQYVGQIAAAVKKATGRELRLEGPVEMALFPKPGIKTGRALLLDDPAFGDAPLLSVESASLSMAFEPLFDGVLAIEDVTVSGARLKLVRGLDGRGNWEQGTKPAEDADRGGTPPGQHGQHGQPEQPEPGVTPLSAPDGGATGHPASNGGAAAELAATSKRDAKRFEARVDGVTVTDLAVSYHDESGAASYSAAMERLELQNAHPGTDIPLRLEGTLRDDRSGRLGAFSLDAIIRFSREGDASARVKALRCEVQGLAEAPLVFEGAAALRYEKTAQRLEAAEISASLALAPHRAALEGNLVWQGGVTAGRTEDGLAEDDSTMLTGSIRAADLDIDAWRDLLSGSISGDDSASEGGAVKGAPNMTRPTVTRRTMPGAQAQGLGRESGGSGGYALFAAGPDADVAFSAASVTVEALPLRQVEMPVRFKNGELEASCTATLYGGAVKAALKAELGGKSAAIALSCSVGNLDLGQATAGKGGSYSVTGLLDASLDVTGQGPDAQAVLHSLKGKASARAKGGDIRGFTLIPADLRGIKPVPVDFPYTSMSASAVIKEGTATSRDISLVSKVLTGRGGGLVRLAFKQLDIGVDFMLAGLPPAVPVAISGPFNSLSTSVDMRTFMRNVAEAGVNAPGEAVKGVVRGVGELLFMQ